MFMDTAISTAVHIFSSFALAAIEDFGVTYYSLPLRELCPAHLPAGNPCSHPIPWGLDWEVRGCMVKAPSFTILHNQHGDSEIRAHVYNDKGNHPGFKLEGDSGPGSLLTNCVCVERLGGN